MKLKHLFENEMTAKQAYNLAEQKGTRIPEYEDIIAKSSEDALWYAKNIIKGRWPEAEPTIAKNSDYACWYAKDVIKGRWKEAESHIKKDNYWWNYYLHLFPEARILTKSDPLMLTDGESLNEICVIIQDVPATISDDQFKKLFSLLFPDKQKYINYIGNCRVHRNVSEKESEHAVKLTISQLKTMDFDEFYINILGSYFDDEDSNDFDD